MIKVIVDRKKWLRGEGKGTSMLLRPIDGKMCCLGFAALAMGLNEDDISNVSSFSQLKDSCRENFPAFLDSYRADSYEASLIMIMNDKRYKDEEVRENYIKEKGKDLDLDFEFIN